MSDKQSKVVLSKVGPHVATDCTTNAQQVAEHYRKTFGGCCGVVCWVGRPPPSPPSVSVGESDWGYKLHPQAVLSSSDDPHG